MSTTTEIRTTLRNAALPELIEVLRAQADVRFDHVASASALRFERGNLVIDGAADAILTDEGVTTGDAVLRPTDVFDGGIADRLGIPVRYLRRMRSAAITEYAEQFEAAMQEDGPVLPNVYADLLDHNVNTWLAAEPDRKWLIRGFLAAGAGEGIARAFLSDRFGMYDNLDFLMAALAGAKRGGAQLEVVSVDLSERRMRVKVAAPEIVAMAPTLLRNYRSPFDNASPERQAQMEAHGFLRPDDRPVVFGGFIIGNSETGNGSWTIAPHLTVLACTNGMTIKADALRGVHLGGKLDEGTVRWSDDTMRKNMDLISAQASDAVESFTSPAYVEAKVAEIEAAAGVAVTTPVETLEKVGKQFGFTKSEQDMILADFIAGGSSTAGGVMQAVTSVAQRVEDPDRAAEFEESAIDVLVAAAKFAG